MIYSRWGNPVELVRPAGKEDVEQMSPPWDNEAQVNLAAKSWWVIRDADTHKEDISHLGFLRADNNWPEIHDAMVKCPKPRCLWCGDELEHDEHCGKAKCLERTKKSRQRMGLNV